MELLVVIVIIAVTAALAFTVGSQVMKRGESAKSLQNSEVKIPMLFVDGHVETMAPKEHFNRKLDEMPKKL